jgi:hypothetical protein
MKPLKVNADYEVELFHQKLAPPAMNQSIEFLLFFLESRSLFSQKKYSSEYLHYVEKLTGRAPQIVNKGPFENYWGSLKNIEVEEWWNSKLTSSELIIQKGWCTDTLIIRSEDDLKKISTNRDLLLKDPYGMSGQKFQLLRFGTSLKERQEVLEKSLRNKPFIIEPYLNRRYDFSQYIFPDGKVIAYQNEVDEKFQYKGTVFNCVQSACLEDLTFYSQISEAKWDHFRDQTQQIIDFYSLHPNELGYSIDSFIYQENDELNIRVMSEINYRRTMGRMTYELSHKYAANKSWTALLMAKTSVTPLWKIFSGNEGVMVLSPGDSRFEILFLYAQNRAQGLELIAKLNRLLPDTEFTIKI